MSTKLMMGIAAVVAVAVVGYFFLPAFNQVTSTNMEDSSQQASSTTSSTDTTAGAAAQNTQANGLVIQDEVVGTGETAKVGDTISVNYTGKFQDGKTFDTSVGKAPFQFVLGGGQVIAGWDQGFAGMKVGGKRLLIVPPTLGYGPNNYGPIPGNSTLVFEIELLKVTSASNVAPIPEGPQS